MSRKAVTATFAFGLYRKQQSGVFLFRDYEEVARRLAAELLSN